MTCWRSCCSPARNAFCLDRDADAGAVVGIGAGGALALEVADQVALHDRKAAAFVEVGDGDAERRAVDRVVGDHGAFEAEFRIDRDLADVGGGVADNLEIGGGVAAHGREGRARDAVAAHDHVAGAEDVDGVAVLARAAALVGDVLDAVVEHQRAVVGLRRSPDQDAVVAGAADGVVLDRKAAGVHREDRGFGGVVYLGAGDGAFDAFEGDAVATRIDDLAIDDADRAAERQAHQRAVVRQRLVGAVDGQAGEGDVVCTARADHARAAGEDETRRAADADKLGACGELQFAGAVFAGTENQRHAGAGGLVDRRLQHVGLFGAAAGADADRLEFILLGKTAAMYMYPFEDHGPVARETLLDQWARWAAWLDPAYPNPAKPGEIRWFRRDANGRHQRRKVGTGLTQTARIRIRKHRAPSIRAWTSLREAKPTPRGSSQSRVPNRVIPRGCRTASGRPTASSAVSAAVR